MNTINIIFVPGTKRLVKVRSLIDDVPMNWSDQSRPAIYGSDKEVMRINEVLPRIKRMALRENCKIIRSY